MTDSNIISEIDDCKNDVSITIYMKNILNSILCTKGEKSLFCECKVRCPSEARATITHVK